MSMPRHVALVGCGFTGTSAFFQLVDRCPVEEISIFEASGEFGPGYPYRPAECPDYLINNTNDTLCLVPSNRRAFVTWLAGRPDLAPDLDEKGHAPRAVFGLFLKEVFEAARISAMVKGIRVNLVPAEVTAMRETGEGRVVLAWDGGETQADAAILTTGRCPDIDPFAHPPEGSPARYIANHVMSDAFGAIPLDASVHVLGASLSAYDVINRLFAPSTGCRFMHDGHGALVFEPGENRRSVVLCSRGGRVKSVQSRHPAALERRSLTPQAMRARARAGELTLDDIAAAFRDEVAAAGIDLDWGLIGDPYRGCSSAGEANARAGELIAAALAAATDPARRNVLVDLFAQAQIDIWDMFGDRLLDPREEMRYRERFETAALSHAAPCPVPTAEKLLALHRAGRLAFVKGVREVALAPGGAAYRITHDFGEEAASILVNTTGSVDRDVTSPRQPALIRDLAARGLLKRYERGGLAFKGASVEMASLRAEGARNIHLANMLLWGPGFFTSSAFVMATMVERILAELFPRQAGGG
jgi:hypothetical protein